MIMGYLFFHFSFDESNGTLEKCLPAGRLGMMECWNIGEI